MRTVNNRLQGRSVPRLHLSWFGLMTLACTSILAAPAAAQDLFLVTGVSGPGVAMLQAEAGQEPAALRAGSDFEEGAIRLSSDHQLMLLTDSGAVIIAIGPATLVCQATSSHTTVSLQDGAMMVASAPDDDGGGYPLQIQTYPEGGEEGAARAIVVDNVRGRLFVERVNGRTRVAYIADAVGAPQIDALAYGKPTSLQSGGSITLESGEAHPADTAEWLSDQKFRTPWGEALGVSSARIARTDVETRLFDNITTWDRYGEEYVKGRLEAGRFKPEVRQVVVSVSSPARLASAGSAVPQTISVIAANEIPLFSPAALSISNPVDGVTAAAIANNTRAGNLLSQTGSRGLGFGGLGQLAIQGIFGPGAGGRAIGPAGLGAGR